MIEESKFEFLEFSFLHVVQTWLWGSSNFLSNEYRGHFAWE
jgi:hypothetical protein